MLILYLVLCILGLLIVIVASKLKTLARALEERRLRKQQYLDNILNSIRNISTAVTPVPRDNVRDTLAAIQNLRHSQINREAVEDLIDSLDDLDEIDEIDD